MILGSEVAGKDDGEGGSFFVRGLDADDAAVGLGDLAADVEAEAGASGGAVSVVLGEAHHGVEEDGEGLGGDCPAGVVDGEGDLVAGAAQGGGDGAVRRAVGDGVHEEVGQELAEAGGVPFPGEVAVPIEGEGVAGGGGADFADD